MGQKKSYIYVLKDPDTDEVKYVGQTTNPARRLQTHIQEGIVSEKRLWMIGLVEQGKRPVMEIVEEVEEGALEKEQGWIAKLLAAGAALLNINLGKEGPKQKRSPRHQRLLRPRGPRPDKGQKAAPEVTQRRVEARQAARLANFVPRTVPEIPSATWAKIEPPLMECHARGENVTSEMIGVWSENDERYVRKWVPAIAAAFPDLWEIQTTRGGKRGPRMKYLHPKQDVRPRIEAIFDRVLDEDADVWQELADQ